MRQIRRNIVQGMASTRRVRSIARKRPGLTISMLLTKPPYEAACGPEKVDLIQSAVVITFPQGMPGKR